VKLEQIEKEAEKERERVEKERAEKEKQREREFELKKMKLAQIEKEKEREAEKERVLQLEKLKFEERQKEKERNYELERIRLEKEVEVQRIRSEYEIRTAEMNRQRDGESDANGTQGGHRARSVAMKALKLPPFNEDKDDLDAYLTRFERACTAFDVEPEYWSTQLARLLQGRSLDVYQRLTLMKWAIIKCSKHSCWSVSV